MQILVKMPAYSRIFLVLCGLIISPCSLAQHAVIVNANNPYNASESEMREVVKRLFLKQQSTWPNGITAKCYDRSKASAEQVSFNRDLLGMSDAVIARHWLGVKQTTGETPPRNVGPTSILGKFVGKYDGGLGIVESGEIGSLPSNVRVLFTF